jgi:NAD(P)H-dependent FMN reductase
MSDTQVVGVAGSLRDGSHTRAAIRIALEGAESVGAATELLDPREYELPMYDPDIDGQGDGDALRATLQAADAVLLGTPMYHGSYSNVTKNVLDYAGFDEFEGTTVGLLGVSGGSFPITALDHLRSVCRSLNAWVLPHQAAVPSAHDAFDGETLTNDRTQERVRLLGARAVQYANIEPDPATFEAGQNVGAGE